MFQKHWYVKESVGLILIEKWGLPDWLGPPISNIYEEEFYWGSGLELHTWKRKRKRVKQTHNIKWNMENINHRAQRSKVLNHHISTWGSTHVFRVAMRQRHSPSLVLLFLCLKLPNILSHKYCNNTQQTACVWAAPFLTCVRRSPVGWLPVPWSLKADFGPGLAPGPLHLLTDQ